MGTTKQLSTLCSESDELLKKGQYHDWVIEEDRREVVLLRSKLPLFYGRGSPICKNLHLQVVEQFQNIVPQKILRIWRNLGIRPKNIGWTKEHF